MNGDGPAAATDLVAECFPDARAAWLGGSVVRGDATTTSDLDVTVLMPGPPAPYRESLVFRGWPVELFVHTESSLGHYREKDQDRRQPTIMRLVGESVLLVDRDGSGVRLQREMAAAVSRGPRPLDAEELASRRYGVTDLMMDLEGGGPADEQAAVACLLWQQAAELLLTAHRRWTGTGKTLVRELRAFDDVRGTHYGEELPRALRAAVMGDVEPLLHACESILSPLGGRLFDGHRLSGADPGTSAAPR